MDHPVIFATNLLWRTACVGLAFWVLLIPGLLVLGLVPALVAVIWAVGQDRHERSLDVLSGMWREYRAEFLRGNMLAGPAVLALCLAPAIGLAGPAALAGKIIALWLAALWITAVALALSRWGGDLRDGFANALTITAQVPYRISLALLLVPVLAVCIQIQPVLGLCFAAPLWALAVMKLTGLGRADAPFHPQHRTTETAI